MKSKIQRSLSGFMVVERCEDWEQILVLFEDPAYPPGGLLSWPVGGERRAIFLSRKDARDAIRRTDHYGKAFSCDGEQFPSAKSCKIVPVETITFPKP